MKTLEEKALKSEDEKIRKELADFIYITTFPVKDLKKKERFLTWLEKQGEMDEDLIAKKFLINKGYPIDANGTFPTYEELYNIIREGFENQGEQNPYSGVSFKYNGHIYGMFARDNGVEILVDGKIKERVFPQGKSALEAVKEEKVDNQNCVNPADRVEPKFKVGDWITNEESVWQIDEVKTENYLLIDSEGILFAEEIATIDSEFHLWTIQDAKDGDVLQLGRVIAIFQKYIGKGNCKCHCSVYDGEFEIPSQDSSYGCDNAIPATKEQRDTLMKAMGDARYTFDFEKKELKKFEDEPENYKQQVMSKMTDLAKDYIRQKSTEWTEEDKSMLLNVNCIIDEVWHSENTFGYSREELEDMWYWLNVAWHRLHYPIEDENWSEEDEHWRQKAIDFIKHPDLIKATPTLAKDTIYWLKFLRPKNSYNPYKATVESIAKMCDKYERCIQDDAEARDFLANVRVKCKDAAEYDKKYPQKQ